jgi:hypothetical protein
LASKKPLPLLCAHIAQVLLPYSYSSQTDLPIRLISPQFYISENEKQEFGV